MGQLSPAGDQVAVADKWHQHERISDGIGNTRNNVTYLHVRYVTASPRHQRPVDTNNGQIRKHLQLIPSSPYVWKANARSFTSDSALVR